MFLAKSGKILAATQTDFGPDGFRSSSPARPASQFVSNASHLKNGLSDVVPSSKLSLGHNFRRFAHQRPLAIRDISGCSVTGEGARSRSSCPQSLSRYIADSACASILNNLASPSAAAGSAGEQVSGRLSGGTRLSTLAPHPTIDASTRGRGRIAHRSAELGYGRTAVDVVWIRDEKCPFMPAKASPNHKLDALVDHEVRSGCCGTDVAAGSTQTRRQRYRRTG
jgi:hypothetical protein